MNTEERKKLDEIHMGIGAILMGQQKIAEKLGVDLNAEVEEESPEKAAARKELLALNEKIHKSSGGFNY